MQTLVVFDIGDNKLRTRIENACMDCGMQRTQFSLFQGELTATRRKKLAKKVENLVNAHTEKESKKQIQQALLIHFFALCSTDFKNTIQINRSATGTVPPIRPPAVVIL
ncbi:MAG: CRISPR-associated endonuclease Cas2 [Candidatus Hydrogenedentes bacterium]|nr:CRISPR-associated endonuclease Cas2 [Candidatus Hydrogenedentota bacterium]